MEVKTKIILGIAAVIGAVIVYKTCFASDSATEKKSGADGGCGCGCSGEHKEESNYIGAGDSGGGLGGREKGIKTK